MTRQLILETCAVTSTICFGLFGTYAQFKGISELSEVPRSFLVQSTFALLTFGLWVAVSLNRRESKERFGKIDKPILISNLPGMIGSLLLFMYISMRIFEL